MAQLYKSFVNLYFNMLFVSFNLTPGILIIFEIFLANTNVSDIPELIPKWIDPGRVIFTSVFLCGDSAIKEAIPSILKRLDCSFSSNPFCIGIIRLFFGLFVNTDLFE